MEMEIKMRFETEWMLILFSVGNLREEEGRNVWEGWRIINSWEVTNYQVNKNERL